MEIIEKAAQMDDPFGPLDGEMNTPIDGNGHDFQFTRNWFRSRNQKTWSTFLPPKFNPAEPHNMIQIGVFEGMDLVWCMQNIMTHPQSRVLAVDPWQATSKLDAGVMEGCYNRAQHNLRPWRDQIDIQRGFSQTVLAPLAAQYPDYYDLAVIDGDHTAPAVLADAELCLELVKPGGWLVFDDVRNRIPKRDHVQAGIEQFLEWHGDRVELAWRHRFVDCYEVVA